MQREFGPIANNAVDQLGREVSGTELKAMFWREYIERNSPWQLKSFETESKDGVVKCRAKLLRNGKPVEFSGEGNGPLAALVHGFSQAGVPRFEIANYREHALSSGEEAVAISYIQIKTADGKSRWGAGVDTKHRTGLGARGVECAEPVIVCLWTKPSSGNYSVLVVYEFPASLDRDSDARRSRAFSGVRLHHQIRTAQALSRQPPPTRCCRNPCSHPPMLLPSVATTAPVYVPDMLHSVNRCPTASWLGTI